MKRMTPPSPMSKTVATMPNAVKDLIRTRETIFAFIIGLLMCFAWDLPYVWIVLCAVPLIGLFHGMKYCEGSAGSTRDIATKFQIGMLCVMVIVTVLSIYERYQIEPSLQQARRILRHETLEKCMKSCEELYGFRFLVPSTWHLLGNNPLNECYDRCSERHAGERMGMDDRITESAGHKMRR
jgi:hypothetical protein